MIFAAVSLLAASPALAAIEVQEFKPPAPCPTCESDIYVGKSNGSLPVAKVVPGHAYDRFITIWLENTDYASAAASETFQQVAKGGILLTDYNAVTHPSQPNYVAAMAGDFFGMHDDDNYFLPTNVSTAVDLLESRNISWASYQENMPTDGFALDFTQRNYLNETAGNYTYYKRKHNPHINANSIAGIPERALRVRNFNDFAVDVNASALPQHVWITPNLVNDGHDTDVNFMNKWLEYWLIPLLQNPNFNDNRTLVHLTFDENESFGIQNTIYTVLTGGAVPAELRGTNDSTFYTHYSMLSSIENNWDLPSLGRNDVNATVASVWAFQANITNHTNYVPQPEEVPQLNLTGVYPGACNTDMWTPIAPPLIDAKGAGNNSVFYNVSSTDLKAVTPAPVNLTAAGQVNPLSTNPNYTYVGASVVNSSSPAAKSAASGGKDSSKGSGALPAVSLSGVAAALLSVAAGVAVLF